MQRNISNEVKLSGRRALRKQSVLGDGSPMEDPEIHLNGSRVLNLNIVIEAKQAITSFDS